LLLLWLLLWLLLGNRNDMLLLLLLSCCCTSAVAAAMPPRLLPFFLFVAGACAGDAVGLGLMMILEDAVHGRLYYHHTHTVAVLPLCTREAGLWFLILEGSILFVSVEHF
jgi:hypothetical protein